MKSMMKWLLPLLCAVCLLWLLPTAQAASAQYGAATIDKLNVRAEPNKNAASLFQVNTGAVMQLMNTVTPDQDVWYQVRIANPANSTDIRTAYIMAEYVRPLSASEQQLWLNQQSSGGTLATGRIINQVNLRVRPSINSSRLASLVDGEMVQVLAIPNAASVDAWYKVVYNNMTGYVMARYLRVVNTGSLKPLPVLESGPITAMVHRGYVKVMQNGTKYASEPAGKLTGSLSYGTVLSCVGTTYSSSSGSTWYAVLMGANQQLAYIDAAYVLPCTRSGTLKDYLTADSEGNAYEPMGTVATTVSRVYIRKSASTTANALELIEEMGQCMPYYETTTVSGVTWYLVRSASGVEGWVMGTLLTHAQSAPAPTPTTAPTAIPDADIYETPVPQATQTPTVGGPLGYVQTNISKVYVRSSPSSNGKPVDMVIEQGTQLPYDDTHRVGRVLWFHVTLPSGVTGWMKGTCLNTVGALVTAAPAATATPKPTPVPTYAPVIVPTTAPTYAPVVIPSAAPQGDILRGYAAMTAVKVYLRADPGMSAASLTLVTDKETMPYYEKATLTSGVWYRVRTASGQIGWMSGQYLTAAQVLVPDQPAQMPSSTAANGQYMYTTVDKVYVRSANSTSAKALTQVARAGTALPYTETKPDSKGVTWYKVQANGITGWMIGTYLTANKGGASAPVNAAELVQWSSGVIQSLWENGQTAIVYDVISSKAWVARKLYGDSHADIEPFTAADTATLCQIYGVSSASQLSSRMHGSPRPCLVTIGSRTFACSLYGVPHGEQSITNNSFVGKCCLYFPGSVTHGSKASSPEHEAAARQAWSQSPSGRR